MALDPSAMAASITAAQGPAQDTSIQDDANLKIATGICNYLNANLKILVPSSAILSAVNLGNSTALGPTTPVQLSVAP